MASTVELRAILRDEITAGLKNIEAELENVKVTGKGAGEGISSGMTTALPTVRGVTDALGAQNAKLTAQRDAMKTGEYQAYAERQREIKKEIEALERANGGGAESFLTMGNAVKGFMALQVVGYVKDAAGAIYDATAQMDSLKMGLKAVMGGSYAASQEIEKLAEVAKLPGLGYAEAIRMSVSLQSTGMSADLARKAMMSFGNALGTVGKGKADLDGVGLALSQIIAKGKVSAEEINQIAERVPQIRKAMEGAFGTGDTEILQKMQMSSTEFIDKISTELGKLEQVTGGMRNSAENLSDQWFLLKTNLGDVLAVETASEAIGSFFGNLLEAANAHIKNITGTQAAAMAKAFQEENAAGKSAVERFITTRVDAEKAYASFVKKSADERAGILKGIYENENIWIDTSLTIRLEKLVQADRAQAKIAAGQKDADRVNNAARAALSKKDKAMAIESENAFHAKNLEVLRIAHANELMENRRHEQALEEIKNKGPKSKEDHSARDAANRESAEMVEHWADVDKHNAEEQAKAKKIRESEFQLDLKDMQKKDAAQHRLNDAATKREARDMEVRRKMQEFLWEQEREIEEHNAKMIEGAWMSAANTMQGTFSTAFMEIGKKHGEFMATLTEGFEGALNKMASDLAANAAIFGILSLFGGPAASFATGAGGLTGAIFGQRATGGSVGGGAYLVGENRPEVFRPTVPGQIHNSTSNTSYGGVTINVHGGGADPKAIAAAVVRAQKIQALGHKATSR